MITDIALCAASLVTGVVAGVAIATYRLRARLCPDLHAHELSDDDRAHIEAEFAAHTSAANRAISEFADALAGTDRDLRNRLRRFETGGYHS
ncbi:hypothetical protein [Gordonia aichiensis]|uniref:Uncharacterized protein n=1 Tax=Gordonia aichiensis NBRC 108223 TaxID=1220583 RepID=L7KST5_9ACTN|nr:hypothetical protein [Gordonia aichiensis]GAC50992.1 hypothetical protein GOACH_36_00140 [Gordonia aichiensis NBRC 108223]